MFLNGQQVILNRKTLKDLTNFYQESYDNETNDRISNLLSIHLTHIVGQCFFN